MGSDPKQIHVVFGRAKPTILEAVGKLPIVDRLPDCRTAEWPDAAIPNHRFSKGADQRSSEGIN